MCQNTSLEFQIKVLPGIHFYQSDIPYEQIDQNNIWTKWAPTPELLAATPGREKDQSSSTLPKKSANHSCRPSSVAVPAGYKARNLLP
jgi:hypothetical protein